MSLRRSPARALSAAALLLVLACAAFGPWVAPYERSERDPSQALQAPSRAHWMGTGEAGEDLLTELILGARVAVLVGGSVVLVSLTVGVPLGAVAGYFGGVTDAVVMRGSEVLLSFPGVLLAILLLFVTDQPSTATVILAISATSWTGYARLVRGQVLLEKKKDYVEAARALGIPTARILARHILPNTVGPIMVHSTFGVAAAILAEASLSFLGLGPQDSPSWGATLDQGAQYFLLTGHVALFPGLAILVTVLSINLVGDALRDRWDPRTKDGA